MSMMESPITGVSIVYSIVCSGADQRKHQSSASLAFVRGIHRGPVNSPYQRPVTWKIFPFGDVILMIPGAVEVVHPVWRLLPNWGFSPYTRQGKTRQGNSTRQEGVPCF